MLKRALPGTVNHLSGETFNALLDELRPRPITKTSESNANAGLVYVYNNSGADVGKFGILQPSDTFFPTADSYQNQAVFKANDPVVSCIAPAAGKQFVVVQEPIKAGKFGWAMFNGVTQCALTGSGSEVATATTSNSTLTAKSFSDLSSGDFYAKLLTPTTGGLGLIHLGFFKQGQTDSGGYYKIYWKVQIQRYNYTGTWQQGEWQTWDGLTYTTINHGHFYTQKIPNETLYKLLSHPSYAWAYSTAYNGWVLRYGTQKWADFGSDYNNPSNYRDWPCEGNLLWDFGGWTVSDYSHAYINNGGYAAGYFDYVTTVFSSGAITSETDPGASWYGSGNIPNGWIMPDDTTADDCTDGSFPTSAQVYGAHPNTKQWR